MTLTKPGAIAAFVLTLNLPAASRAFVPLKTLVRFLLLGFVAISCGCTLVSTGARSAIVVLVRNEVTTAGAAPLPVPPRDEIKSALSHQFLWLADDKRAAQWIAYINVRTPPTALQPFGLTVVEVKKNPDWDPLAVSSPISSRDSGRSIAHELLEQNEQRERSLASSSK